MPGDYDATKREAKAFLKEIMEEFPDPEEELIEIWEAWFERMTDGNHPVYLTPMQLAGLKSCFDEAYAELKATSG
jgi:hypothetical protein